MTMSPLSLTEAAKLSQDDLQRGVLETFVQESPILDRVPFMTVEGNALLTSHERKTLAEFQQELAELIDKSLFEVRFQVSLALRQTGEFQDVGIFYEVGRLLDFLTLFGQRQHAVPISTEGKPLE